jgi:alcohol dehydrogenase (cytochrome c)
MKGRISRYVASFAALGNCRSHIDGRRPHQPDLLNDAATPGDVLTNGLGPQGQRFNSLAQLNASNVKKLVPAFAASLGGEKQRGQDRSRWSMTARSM